MTAANAWEAAGDGLPREISTLLDQAGTPALQALELLAAIPEWQVALPGGTRNSCTDVVALARNDAGLVAIGVEAKVLEDFGPTVAEQRSTPPTVKELGWRICIRSSKLIASTTRCATSSFTVPLPHS